MNPSCSVTVIPSLRSLEKNPAQCAGLFHCNSFSDFLQPLQGELGNGSAEFNALMDGDLMTPELEMEENTRKTTMGLWKRIIFHNTLG
jgi:hypothetical protein